MLCFDSLLDVAYAWFSNAHILSIYFGSNNNNKFFGKGDYKYENRNDEGDRG